LCIKCWQTPTFDAGLIELGWRQVLEQREQQEQLERLAQRE
jgi:hypothetical protein